MARPASQAKARAKALGLSRYRELTPCKYGHDSERYTKTGICVACTRARKSWNREPKTAPYGPFITQEQAQAAGLRHFYNGQACKSGHVGLKYANGSGCVDCAVERANDWKGCNREKTRKSGRIYNKTKRNNAKELAARESNPRSRAAARIRALLKNTIVAYGGRKACKTEALLGCSVDEARAWLEARFQPGMRWENHGEWHIDHVKPCASFDLTDEAQQKLCCHYTNLQPLWAKDNLLKGAKMAE